MSSRKRILCAIGPRNGPDLVRNVLEICGTDCELVLMHVIDTHPRHHMEHLRGPLRHGPHGGPHREHELQEAEDTGGKEALDEGLEMARKGGIEAKSKLERGHPEHMIVEEAQALNADLIAIGAREHSAAHPHAGPGSVGHTARFVLDHAHCPVLLLRTWGAPAPSKPHS